MRSFNDYPTVGGTNPAFSGRAVEALRDLLEPNGEILPLSTALGTYFAFNVTTVADILDLRKSKVQWIDENAFAADVDRYEIIPKRLTGLTIFRLNQQPSRTYVTQPFVARVQEHGLRGMNFIRVWPLPSDVSWKELRKAQWGRRDRKGLPLDRHSRETQS